MSRRVELAVTVTCDNRGVPVSLTFPGNWNAVPIFQPFDHWREWFGIIDGEPERDVWQVETPQGICELHCLRTPQLDDEPGFSHWLLYRWED